jgi:YYY domain-containing protein
VVASALGWAAIWLLWLLLLGAVAFPLAHRLMPGLPSRGVAMSPALGVLLISYVAWLLASLHLVPFGRGALLLALALIALLSAWSEMASRGAALRWLRRHGGLIAAFGAAFLIVFACFFWLRGFYPDVRSTEKPMEIGFLTSTMRARWMPPNDAWLSGFTINYYYFGYVETAALGLLGGLRPEISFNLMSITLPAMTFCGASGIVYDLLGRWRRGRRSLAPQVRPVLAALVGGLLIAVAGDAYGFARLISAPAEILQANFWTGIGWNSSRVIYDHIVPGSPSQMITEFPLFSFILGDIHPHVLALPTVLLAVGVGFGFWVRPAGWRAAAIPRYLLAALVIGALYPTNAWDLPTYALLAVAAIVLRRPEGWLRRIIRVGGLLVGAVVLFAPYYLHFKSLVGHQGDEPPYIQNLETMPVIGTIIKMFGVVTWPHTSLPQFLAFFALPLAAAGTVALRGCIGMARRPTDEERRAYLIAALAVVAVAVVTRTPMLLPTGLVVIPGVYAMRRPLSRRVPGGSPWSAWTPVDRAAVAVAVYGALLPVIPEFVFLRDAFDNRMNTMFKVDYQAWVLMMLAGAYGIVTLLRTVRAEELRPLSVDRRPLIAAARIGMTIFAAMAIVYPLLVPYQRTGHFGSEGIDFGGPAEGWKGMDGFQYVAQTNPDEFDALMWLRAHSGQDDRLVEAPGNSYGDSHGWFQSRFGAASGIPDLLGWYFHEVQWRGGTPAVIDTELPERAADIGTLYGTTNTQDARRILDKYRINWVVVGLNEEEGEGHCAISLGCPPYPPAGLAKFKDMLELAYQHGSVSIYHVP